MSPSKYPKPKILTHGVEGGVALGPLSGNPITVAGAHETLLNLNRKRRKPWVLDAGSHASVPDSEGASLVLPAGAESSQLSAFFRVGSAAHIPKWVGARGAAAHGAVFIMKWWEET